MVQKNSEMEQEQQYINGTEHILLKVCMTEGNKKYNQKS